MPQRIKDMVGHRVGSLVVLARDASSTHEARWVCRCDCGREKLFTGSKLRRAEAFCVCSGGHEHHGLTAAGRDLYRVWANMKYRCTVPSNPSYARYGGRGIKVCDEWMHSFSAFHDWAVANDWRKGLEIDRRDNDGNYEPGNCRIVTSKVNCRNKSSNRHITFQGETRLLVEWAELADVPMKTLHARLALGWSMERALTAAVARGAA